MTGELTVLDTVRRDGIVPVFYSADVEVVQHVARSVVTGGLHTLEFTNRGDGAVEVFAELSSWVRRELPDLLLGAGTVVDPATAASYLDLGAAFVFAPSFSAEVALTCNRRHVPYVPGCGTVTEIQTAYEHGVDFVKLFPATTVGGPAFLSAVRAPCPWIEAIPTGGVEPTVSSLSPWFDAGAPAVGMGSKLFSKEQVRSGDWDGVTEGVRSAVAAVAEARGW